MNPTHHLRRLILDLGGAVGRLGCWRRVEVEGASMRPALEPGDRLLVTGVGRVRPGRIVALADPRDGRILVKRVAARDRAGVDVRGDDPDASTDSRTFGPVAPAAILGVAVYRYAPADRVGRIDGIRRGSPPGRWRHRRAGARTRPR